jgi:cyclohexanecarboxylate-CoA ligase
MWYETSLTRARADRDRGDGRWTDRLLNDDLDDAAARHPDTIAFVDARGRTSWRELREQADHAALGLLERGVRRGDAVLVQLPAWTEFAVLTLALERIGAVIYPAALNAGAGELRAVLDASRSVTAVFARQFRGMEYGLLYRDLSDGVSSLRVLVAVDGSPDGAVTPWRQLLADGAAASRRRAALDWLRPAPDDICQVLLARDAEGELRGTLHTANTLGAAVEAVIRGQRLTPEDVIHSAASPAHQLGSLLGVRLPIRLGARAVLQDTWEVDAFLRLVEAEGIAVTFGGRPVLAGVLAALERSGHDLGTLRLLGVSGLSLPASLADEAVRRLPGRVSPLWGTTEAGVIAGVLPDCPAQCAITSAGRAYPGMEIVARDGAGAAVPPGSEGVLWVRGASLFAGYLQGRAFTERFCDADGWFNTGERGVVHAGGCVSLRGRGDGG